MAKVAFLGLGVMGYPMAGHLLKKGGHDVTVYNRTAAKAEKWASENGGVTAPTPRDAAKGQDIVFCCVGNDDDLRSVVLGDDGASSIRCATRWPERVWAAITFITTTSAGPRKVIAGISPPFRQCFQTIVHSETPFARAVRTKSWLSISSIPPRVSRAILVSSVSTHTTR